jgi:hypothetical protein
MTSRLLQGPVQVAHTSDDRSDFSACEELINAFYRIGETQGDHPERFSFLTDDTIVEMENPARPSESFRTVGKDAVVSWYLQQSAKRSAGRLHVPTNFIWRKLPSGEVHCQNLMFYYEPTEDPNGPIAAPLLIADCVHKFRLEGQFWKMSLRYYSIRYSAVTGVPPEN